MNRVEYKFWLMGALSGLDATQEQIDLIIKEYEKATQEKVPTTTVTTTLVPSFGCIGNSSDVSAVASIPNGYSYFPQGYKPNGDY